MICTTDLYNRHGSSPMEDPGSLISTFILIPHTYIPSRQLEDFSCQRRKQPQANNGHDNCFHIGAATKRLDAIYSNLSPERIKMT